MTIILMLLIGHFLGEYILQPNSLVKKKSECVGFIILHAGIYAILSFFVFIIFGQTWEYIVFSIIVFATHFGIDWLRTFLSKKFHNRHFVFWSYIIDQLIHIVILIVLGVFVKNDFNEIGKTIVFTPYSKLFTWDLDYFLKCVLCFVLILTPSAVFIKYIFAYIYKNNGTTEFNEGDSSKHDTDINRTGAIIGILERLVIMILGLMGLYTSIAIVLTAKSLARFKQLEDKDFAERYLIGTLISLLIALLCLILLKQKTQNT